jgi:hypothetical protein
MYHEKQQVGGIPVTAGMQVGMDRDKASGSDGFTRALFQECWDVIMVDIKVVFSDFYARGKFEKSLNARFISLILKVSGASNSSIFV